MEFRKTFERIRDECRIGDDESQKYDDKHDFQDSVNEFCFAVGRESLDSVSDGQHQSYDDGSDEKINEYSQRREQVFYFYLSDDSHKGRGKLEDYLIAVNGGGSRARKDGIEIGFRGTYKFGI